MVQLVDAVLKLVKVRHTKNIDKCLPSEVKVDGKMQVCMSLRLSVCFACRSLCHGLPVSVGRSGDRSVCLCVCLLSVTVCLGACLSLFVCLQPLSHAQYAQGFFTVYKCSSCPLFACVDK